MEKEKQIDHLLSLMLRGERFSDAGNEATSILVAIVLAKN